MKKWILFLLFMPSLTFAQSFAELLKQSNNLELPFHTPQNAIQYYHYDEEKEFDNVAFEEPNPDSDFGICYSTINYDNAILSIHFTSYSKKHNKIIETFTLQYNAKNKEFEEL